MSWDQHHSRSEQLAAEGERVARSGDRTSAEDLYRQAAEAEAEALDQVSSEKLRTRGITAVASEWGTSENNRRARFYSITRAGRKQLAAETDPLGANRRDHEPDAEGPVMVPLRALVASVLSAFRGRRFDAVLDEEIAGHLERLENEHRGRGLSPQAAR